MEKLQGFSQKDMIEQITLLEEIKDAKAVEAIPELIALYAEPKLDQAVDEMLYHNLYELMSGQDQAVIESLANNSLRVQTLAVRRAGEDGSSSVLPALTELLQKTRDTELLSEIVRALGGFKDPGLTDILLPYLDHENDAVVAWTMNSLVAVGDERARKALEDLVAENAAVIRSTAVCDLKTAKAISSIADYGDAQAVDFLIGYIHHDAASFRRVVISELSTMGEVALPALEQCVLGGDKDEKIMAANVIGWTGQKKGAELLISILDQNDALETNLKFAIYEALGRIPSMRSFIALTDGLAEKEEMVLMAVITGLNDLCNPGIVKTMNDFLAGDNAQAELVVKTIVTGRAKKIFAELYKAGTHKDRLIETIRNSGDAEAIASFKEALEALDVPGASEDAAKLVVNAEQGQTRKVVAADDSKAMLFFYKGAAAELNIDLVTVMDGQEALDYLRSASNVDLLITDMNMPNMDGVELTRELRKMAQWQKLPILMATTESESSQREQATAAGVDDFISKPFTKEVLKEKINEVFS